MMSTPTQSGGSHLNPDAQVFSPSALTLPPIHSPYHPPPPPPLPPAANNPSTGREVLLTTVPSHLTDAVVRAAMEPFGAIRIVEALHLATEGTVTVHFYDLRSAQDVVAAVREQHILQKRLVQQNWVPVMHHQRMAVPGLIAGHAVWAEFVARELDGQNQGSLVVFNCDDCPSLAEIFQSFGDVKDVRATWEQHKFVDFFDTRDAARAVAALNRRGIMGIMGRPMAVKSAHLGGPSRSGSNNKYQGFQFPPRLPRGPHIAETSVQVLLKHTETMFHFKDAGTMVESGSGCRDSRTTVMIKNIPNKYSQKQLLNMLDNHCINCNEQIGGGGEDEKPLSAYDFVYLPIDWK